MSTKLKKCGTITIWMIKKKTKTNENKRPVGIGSTPLLLTGLKHFSTNRWQLLQFTHSHIHTHTHAYMPANEKNFSKHIMTGKHSYAREHVGWPGKLRK